MHLTKISLVIGTLALLTACQTRPPQLSKEEADAKLTATLNVYDDNRVGFKVLDQSSRITWHWTSDKDRILGFAINGKLYNARDLVSITSDRTADLSVNKLTAQFKNGEVQTALAGMGWMQEKKQSGYYGPYWAACDRNKQCAAWSVISQSNHYNSLGEILSFVDDSELKGKITTASIRREVGSDYRAIPTSGSFTRLVALTDAEREQIHVAIDAEHAKREAYYAALQANRAAKEAAVLAEAEQMRKNVRIGTRTNCGSVFDLRLPMVGIQTSVGMQFLPLDKLYGPSANCRFINGNYVGR